VGFLAKTGRQETTIFTHQGFGAGNPGVSVREMTELVEMMAFAI
jgi:hypothetical protein